MHKKKSFLLLEVLIAICLVGVGVFFLIRAPIASIQREIKDLFRLEERRLWRVELMDLEKNLQRDAPGLRIDDQAKPKDLRTDWSCKIQLSENIKKDKEKAYYLFCTHKVSGPEGKTYYKIRVREKLEKGELPPVDPTNRKKVADGTYEYIVAVAENPA